MKENDRENFKEINSYNSIMNTNSSKDLNSKFFRTTKFNFGNNGDDFRKTIDSNGPYKISELDNRTNNEESSMKNNINDLSTNNEESHMNIFTKLPNIHKHLPSATLPGKNNLKNFEYKSHSINNNNYLSLNYNNSSLSKESGSIRINQIRRNSKNRNTYRGSANIINQNYYLYSNKNYNDLFSPPDPLIKRTMVPKIHPRFGKMKAYLNLPEFKGEEPLTKFEYKPMVKDMLTNPSIDKQFEASIYLNCNKMLNNLIYLKTQLSKEGLIVLENLVNVKKLNKNYKAEEEEEKLMNYESVNQFEKIVNSKESHTELNNDINLNFDSSKNISNINFQDNQNKNKEEELTNIQNNLSNQNLNNISNTNVSNVNKHLVFKNSSSSVRTKYRRRKNMYNELKPYYTLKDSKDTTLIFESRFESGNLLCAFKTQDENSYQLYLQNDTNTSGYIQWFFFRVSNTQKGRKVNFNIINMLRKTSIYNHGLKIMTYSTIQAEKENIGWHRDCKNIIYYPNNLFVYNNNNANKKRNLYSLSFDYEFKYDNDIVYFANCLPYFYSTLMKELNKYELNEDKYPFFLRKTIVTTLGGNDLDMFTINSMYDIFKNRVTPIITPKSEGYSILKSKFEKNKNNPINISQILDERKVIVIIARQHPGETVGSFVMKGIFEFLLGDSEEAKKLRELYLFKIIPMMNPDGVLVGNSRTSFAGCDLNRRWTKPNEIIHPEIYKTKQMILKLASQRNIGFIVDCHGHFGTFNSLFYCNHKDNERTCKLFPYICSKLSKIINFQQCSFAMPKYKLAAGRIALFNELEDDDNNNIVALETSFFGINKMGEYSRAYFNSKILKEVGRDLCLGILSYYFKYENIKIEKNVFMSNLEVDMREFESEIIKEVNEDEEEQELIDEKSESEPSVDNLDKNQIMKLMPTNNPKKRKKRKNTTKFKKQDKKKDNKNRDIEIELFNPIKEAAKKLEEERRRKFRSPKIVINCNNVEKTKKNTVTTNLICDTNTKDEYTQTEEIFFKMHWTYFNGQYKILSCNIKTIGNFKNKNPKNNFNAGSVNFYSLRKFQNNFYGSNFIYNNEVIRNKVNDSFPSNKKAKSLNNKIILNNNNFVNILYNGKIFNINKNDKNSNHIILNLNGNDKNNNIKVLKNPSTNQKSESNKFFTIVINNRNLKKEFSKISPSGNPCNKTNNEFNKKNINQKEEEHFVTTKYNLLGNSSNFNDNLKNKIYKSSTAFYKS